MMEGFRSKFISFGNTGVESEPVAINLFDANEKAKMSDEVNDDQWLYGDSINPEPPEDINDNESKNELQEVSSDAAAQDEPMEVPGEEVSLPPIFEPPTIAPPGVDIDMALENGGEEVAESAEDGQIAEGTTDAKETEENGDDDDDDSDEDDVQVVIGDIKATTNYSSLNIKRGGLLTSTGTGDKMKQPGKFSIEEFETVGTINGHEAIDFNLDTLEEKPWRKPGADITDYFNYGFNEETWRSYCERQKRMRIHESGVGLVQLGGSGMLGQKKAGPPPGRKYAGSIDVIGGGGLASRRGLDKGTPPKENVIQVMTADRRDYSRGNIKPGFPDMSMPPPPSGMPPPFDLPPPPHSIIPRIGPPSGPPPFVPHLDPYGNVIGPMGGPPMMHGPPGDFYPPPEVDPYYQSYEPTQDCQWNDPIRKNWQPTSLATLTTDGVKVLTPGPTNPLPPVIQAPRKTSQEPDNQDSQDAFSSHAGSARDGEDGGPVTALGVVIKEEPKDPEERRERRERSDKHKDRSHRHRSRSRSTERRSRRHRSRSRSPGHRSHRKKKSRRSDREKSKEESD